MAWLVPAIISSLCGSAVLTGVYFYLYKKYQQSSTGIWTLSWATYSLRHIALLAFLLIDNHPFLLFLNQSFAFVSSVLLLVGTIIFANGKIHKGLYVGCILGVAWIAFGITASVSFFWLSFPTFFFIGVINIWTGMFILRSPLISGLPKFVTAYTFIFWGLHKIDYPFLRQVEWFAPWGYLLAAVAGLVVSLGMLLIYYEVLNKKLSSAQKWHKTFNEAAMSGIWAVDFKGNLKEVNNKYSQMTGYTVDELTSMKIRDVEALKSENEILALIEQAINEDEIYFETKHRRKDGTVIDVEVNAKHIPQDGIIVVFINDISKRKKTEAINRHTQDLLRYIVEHTRSGVAVHDKDLNYLYVSERYLDDHEIAERDIIGKHHYEVFPDLPQKWRDVHQRVLAGEILNSEKDSYPKDDGSVMWTRWECRPWYEANGRIGGIIVYSEVITDQVNAQEELNKRQYILEKAQEIGQIGSWELDVKKDILLLSDECCRILGVPPGSVVNYEFFLEKVHPEDRKYVDQKWTEATLGKAYDIEHRLLVNGEVKWVREIADVEFDEKGVATRAIGVTQDITIYKKLFEEQSRSAQLVALGTVAAGVAHEINNPINGIINYAQMLRSKPEDKTRVSDLANRISKESERIAKITRDLLHYSKDNRDEMKLIEVNETIKSALDLTASIVRTSGITIKLELGESLPPVMANPQSIQQVVINLFTNAYDAIRVKDANNGYGVIQIKSNLSQSNGKQHICLEVIDNGIGMSEDVLKKATDVFFSTKPSSEGTGLGLSIVHDIIERHKGHMQIDSVIGENTKVKIYIPIVEATS